MWKDILATLIAKAMPVLIDMIINWLKSASDEDVAKVVRRIGAEMESAKKTAGGKEVA